MTTYTPSCDFSFADLLAAVAKRHPDTILDALRQRRASEMAPGGDQEPQCEVGHSRRLEDSRRQVAAWRWYRDVTAVCDASPQNTMAELEEE